VGRDCPGVHHEPFWSPEPLQAVRLNKVVATADGFRFGALSRPEHYGRTVTARCPRPVVPCRPAPGLHCHCGLWACPDRDQLFAAVGTPLGCVVADVALSGTVVEHAHTGGRLGGWRAEHLELHAVSFPSRCWCGARATTLGCAPRLSGPSSTVLVWCDGCAQRLGVTPVAPATLAADLGVELRTGDDDRRLLPTDDQRELLATWWR